MTQTFTAWLDTFVEEKGLDLEGSFELMDVNDTWHLLNYGVVIEFIKGLEDEIQVKVKNTLVQIDYKNGDITHFLRFMAEGMINHNC